MGLVGAAFSCYSKGKANGSVGDSGQTYVLMGPSCSELIMSSLPRRGRLSFYWHSSGSSFLSYFLVLMFFLFSGSFSSPFLTSLSFKCNSLTYTSISVCIICFYKMFERAMAIPS